MALYGKRERYDAAQKRIKDGDWIIDPVKGRISSRRFKSLQDMGTVRDGYNRVSVPCSDGEYRYVSAHRVIWESVHGESDLDLTINHKDGNTLNNSISNLEIASNADNCLHAHRVLGRANQSRNKGASNPQAVLTEEIVVEIKHMIRNKERGNKIAAKFNISQSTVSNIKHGIIWGYVE